MGETIGSVGGLARDVRGLPPTPYWRMGRSRRRGRGRRRGRRGRRGVRVRASLREENRYRIFHTKAHVDSVKTHTIIEY